MHLFILLNNTGQFMYSFQRFIEWSLKVLYISYIFAILILKHVIVQLVTNSYREKSIGLYNNTMLQVDFRIK